MSQGPADASPSAPGLVDVGPLRDSAIAIVRSAVIRLIDFSLVDLDSAESRCDTPACIARRPPPTWPPLFNLVGVLTS